jgi:glycosyltransferase involved in cell wall biosynthesis
MEFSHNDSNLMKIIYVKNGDSSFLRLDEEILNSNFNTCVLKLKNTGRYEYFFSLLKLIITLAFRMPGMSMAFTRFADWHSAIIAFFCRLYRKKLVLVIGGYDAYWLPEFNYGVYHRKTRGKWAKYALRNASMILPNNPRLRYTANKYEPGVTREGGIDFFVPERKGTLRILHNGYHTDFWVPPAAPKNNKLILSVAYVGNLRSYQIKGLKDFIHAAWHMPEMAFRLIGADLALLLKWEGKLPANLTVIESIGRDELLLQYQEAKVFCLLSLTEGMSNVLCEAMLCECIPVVSDVNFNAELVGESGFVITRRDPDLIMDTIRMAAGAAPEKGRSARKRIVENYSLERREKELVQILNEIHAAI